MQREVKTILEVLLTTLLGIAISSIYIIIVCSIYHTYYVDENKIPKDTVIFVLDYKDKSPFADKDPSKYLKDALEYYEISYPDIVYKQAVLETGRFTSKACIEYNNLFGLSYKGELMHFNNWEESVIAYKVKIQYKYKGGDYYEFLKDIGYAEDVNYIEKLKLFKD